MKKITKITTAVTGSLVVVATAAIVPAVLVASKAIDNSKQEDSKQAQSAPTLGYIGHGGSDTQITSASSIDTQSNPGGLLQQQQQGRTQEQASGGDSHSSSSPDSRPITHGNSAPASPGSGNLLPDVQNPITGPLVLTQQMLADINPQYFHSTVYIIDGMDLGTFDTQTKTVVYRFSVRSIATGAESTIRYRMALEISDSQLIKMATVAYKNADSFVDPRVALRLTRDQFTTTLGNVIRVAPQFDGMDELANSKQAKFTVTIQLNNSISAVPNVLVKVSNTDVDELANAEVTLKNPPEGGLNEGNKNEITTDNFQTSVGQVIAYREPITWEIGDNNFYSVQVKLRGATRQLQVQAPHYETIDSLKLNAAKVRWSRAGQELLHERDKSTVGVADFATDFGTVTSIQQPADNEWNGSIVNYMVEITSPAGGKRMVKVAVRVISNAADQLETQNAQALAGVTITKVDPNLKLGLINRGTIGPQSFKASAGTILGVYPTTDPNDWGDAEDLTYNVIVSLGNQRKTFQVRVPYELTPFEKSIRHIYAHHTLLNDDVANPPASIWDLSLGRIIKSELVPRGRAFAALPRIYKASNQVKEYQWKFFDEILAREKLNPEFQAPPTYMGSADPRKILQDLVMFPWSLVMQFGVTKTGYYWPLELNVPDHYSPGAIYQHTDPYYRDDAHHIYGKKLTDFMRWFIAIYQKHKTTNWQGIQDPLNLIPEKKMLVTQFYQRMYWNLYNPDGFDAEGHRIQTWADHSGRLFKGQGVGFTTDLLRRVDAEEYDFGNNGNPEDYNDSRAYYELQDIAKNFVTDKKHIFIISKYYDTVNDDYYNPDGDVKYFHNFDPSLVFFLSIADDYFADFAFYDLTILNPDTNKEVIVRVEAPVNAIEQHTIVF